MIVRLTIEYDPDWTDIAQATQEYKDWIDGNVSVDDILQFGGHVRLEVLEGATLKGIVLQEGTLLTK